METLNAGSSSERSDPVEGGTVLKGRDVPGDCMVASGVRGGVSEYDDFVNTRRGRKSPGMDGHRGDAAGGMWSECDGKTMTAN